MKNKKRIPFAVCLTAALFAGMVTAHAYAILAAGGFTPVPTQVVPYKGFSSSINSAISSACSAWNGAGAGSLVTRSSSTHSNTQFPLNTRLTEVKIVGVIAYNTEVDINVNTAYPWSTTGDPNAYDFQNCFTHELGHLLGLNDENSKSDSTMYSVTSVGETKKRTLAQDDKNGINAIY